MMVKESVEEVKMDNIKIATNFLKNKYSERLVEETADIAKHSDMFLEDLIEIIRVILDVEAITLFTLNKKDEEIYALKSVGAGIEDINKITIKYGIGIVGHTAKDKTFIISNNPESDIRFNRGFDRKTGFKTRNLLSFPIIYNSEIVAILELVNKNGDFLEEDTKILNGIITDVENLLTIALKNNSIVRK